MVQDYNLSRVKDLRVKPGLTVNQNRKNLLQDIYLLSQSLY